MAAPPRQTRGRQKIPMRLIQNQDDLYASFSKRRYGLFKKATELSTLCGAEVGIIVFSPTDNPFSFFSPNMDAVFRRYGHPVHPPKHSVRAIDAHLRARIGALNRRLDELTDEKLRLKAREAQLEEAWKSREKAWWEETAVDSLSKEHVKEWTAWFTSFKSQVENKMAEIQSGAGPSSAAPNGGGSGPNPNFAAPAPTSYFGSASEKSAGGALTAAILNLSGGSAGLAQYLLSSPPRDPFHRRPISSNHAFSPPFLFYMSPERFDPFAAGSSRAGDETEQYLYPTAAPAHVDEGGGSRKGKEILEPLSPTSDEIPFTNYCLTPNRGPVNAAEAENPSPPASNQGEEGK